MVDKLESNIKDKKVAKIGDLYVVVRKAYGSGKRKPGKRGVVKRFSKSSRKRLMKFLAITKWESALFVTLTSKNGVSHEQVEAWSKRYARKFGRRVMVWRKELHESGLVHYHLLIYTKTWLPVKWVIKTWSEILGESGSVSVKYVERGKIGYYISKYMAKVDNADGGSAERERSAAANGGEATGILDKTNINRHSLGRFWGVKWRECARYYRPVVISAIKLTAKAIAMMIAIDNYITEQDWGIYCKLFSFVCFS